MKQRFDRGGFARHRRPPGRRFHQLEADAAGHCWLRWRWACSRLLAIPREEEPQILVPMLDVMTAMPGASPQEIEQRVTNPVERLMHEIPGVEYVYSISSPGQSLVIVRFLVGTSEEDALVKVYSKLYSNAEPHAAGRLAADDQGALHRRRADPRADAVGRALRRYQLRQMADEVQHTIRQIPDVSETTMIGGQPRAMRVILDSAKLAAFGFSPGDVVRRLQAANARTQAGEFADGNQEIRVDAGNLFRDTQDVGGVVLGVAHGQPVYLRDVADAHRRRPRRAAAIMCSSARRASAGRAGEGISRRHHHRGQAQRHQRHRHCQRRAGARERDEGRAPAAPT